MIVFECGLRYVFHSVVVVYRQTVFELVTVFIYEMVVHMHYVTNYFDYISCCL